jgi:hypothetical protein
VKKSPGRTYIFNPNDNRELFRGNELNSLRNYDLFEYPISKDFVLHFYRVYTNTDKTKLSYINAYVFKVFYDTDRLKNNIKVDQKNLNQEIAGTEPFYFLVGYLRFEALKFSKKLMEFYFRGDSIDVDYFYSFSKVYINKPFRKNNMILFFQYIFGLYIQDVELIYKSQYLDKMGYLLVDATDIPHKHCVYCNYYDPTTVFVEEKPGVRLLSRKRLVNIRPEFRFKNYNNTTFQSTIDGKVLTSDYIHIFLPRQFGDFIVGKVMTKLFKLIENGKGGNLGVVLLKSLLDSREFHTSFLEFNNNKAKFLNMFD